MHINYISVLLRSVGNLPGTCWKLFGKPVISEEKIQPEEPNGGKHSAVSFLFCSVWGEGAWLFGPSPGAGGGDHPSSWAEDVGVSRTFTRLSFATVNRTKFTSPPGHTMWGDGITLPLEGPPRHITPCSSPGCIEAPGGWTPRTD